MKKNIKNFYCVLIVFLFLASCQKDKVSEENVSEQLRFEQLDELFTDYKVVTIAHQAILQHSLAHTEQGFTLDLQMEEKPSWVFTMNYHEFYDPDYKAYESDSNGNWVEVERVGRSDAFHGQSVDKQNRAMFIMEDQLLTGSIYEGDIEYFMEPLNRFVSTASPNQYVYYRTDADIIGNAATCGNSEADFSVISDPGNSTALSPRASCRDMSVTYVADYEYRGKFGNNTTSTRNYIENRLRYGSYRYWGYNSYPLYFRLWRSYIKTNTYNRPATSTNSSTFLSQFRAWCRAGNISHGDSNLIYTGRNFGTLFGKAYVGTVCKFYNGQRRAYAMVTKNSGISASVYSKVTGHEVGHMLGCSHQSTGFMKQGNHSNSSMPTATRNELNNYIASNNSCMPYRTCVWYK